MKIVFFFYSRLELVVVKVLEEEDQWRRRTLNVNTSETHCS